MYVHSYLLAKVAKGAAMLLAEDRMDVGVKFAALPRNDGRVLDVFESEYVGRLRPSKSEIGELSAFIQDIKDAGDERNDFVHPWWTWEFGKGPKALRTREEQSEPRWEEVAELGDLQRFSGAANDRLRRFDQLQGIVDLDFAMRLRDE